MLQIEGVEDRAPSQWGVACDGFRLKERFELGFGGGGFAKLGFDA